MTHSNQALNQLFEKIMALDIDERHLLRLGHGEEVHNKKFKSIVMRKVLKKSITVFEFCSKIPPILYLLVITSRINFDPMTKTMVMYGALVSVIWSL